MGSCGITVIIGFRSHGKAIAAKADKKTKARPGGRQTESAKGFFSLPTHPGVP